MVDGAETSDQMTETSELVEAPAAGPQVDRVNPAKPVAATTARPVFFSRQD